MHDTLLRLTDSQMCEVVTVEKTLRRFLRDPFLQAVADLLRDREIGDGSVHAACVKARNLVEGQQRAKRAPATVLDDEDRIPTLGYTATREAAMAAFAKSWRRE
jgi:hypothetical protein